MTRFLRGSARALIASATLVLALLAMLVVPAAAGFLDAVPDDTPNRGTHPLRQAFTDVIGRQLDIPDVDVEVKLECAPRVSDTAAPVVGCEWRAGDDLDVRAWQLWKLQVRPERGGRTLVAEVGADVMAHTDTEVTAPAAYIYAVLGLDSEGEVIARSRLDYVKVPARDHEIAALRLECAPHRAETDRAPSVAIGCEWSEISHDAAGGYVIWKSVDGGERGVLARVGLDTTSIRDGEVAAGHRYTYVVTAVDRNGEVIGRSRANTVAIPTDRPVDEPIDRPTDRPTDRPIDEPVDRPTDRPDRPVDHVRDVAVDQKPTQD